MLISSTASNNVVLLNLHEATLIEAALIDLRSAVSLLTQEIVVQEIITIILWSVRAHSFFA